MCTILHDSCIHLLESLLEIGDAAKERDDHVVDKGHIGIDVLCLRGGLDEAERQALLLLQ